jgi:hypothetical protein
MIGASMIGENLCRAELSPADCAQQRVRRKAIDEELHPEMRHGVIGNGREKSRQVGGSSKKRRSLYRRHGGARWERRARCRAQRAGTRAWHVSEPFSPTLTAEMAEKIGRSQRLVQLMQSGVM